MKKILIFIIFISLIAYSQKKPIFNTGVSFSYKNVIFGNEGNIEAKNGFNYIIAPFISLKFNKIFLQTGFGFSNFQIKSKWFGTDNYYCNTIPFILGYKVFSKTGVSMYAGIEFEKISTFFFRPVERLGYKSIGPSLILFYKKICFSTTYLKNWSNEKTAIIEPGGGNPHYFAVYDGAFLLCFKMSIF